MNNSKVLVPITQTASASSEMGLDTQFIAQISLVVIVTFCIIVIIFLIGRAITLWYFKINEMVKLLEKIEENTKDKRTENQ